MISIPMKYAAVGRAGISKTKASTPWKPKAITSNTNAGRVFHELMTQAINNKTEHAATMSKMRITESVT